MIKVCKRTVDEFNKYGYRTIHLFKDYYLIRNYPIKSVKFSTYALRKIFKEKEDIKQWKN